MSQFALCLSGFGYWVGTQKTSKGMLIRIKVLSEKTSDAVELECVVDSPGIVDQLNELNQACHANDSVILHFSIRYTQFLYCYAGLTKRDPKQMVQLKGKLMECQGWLRGSELPPVTSPREI